jgi:uncharacterized membrane protein YqjE
MQVVSEKNRSVGQIAAELKNDAMDFVSTRLQMLTQEMEEKLSIWKSALPILAIAAVMGVTAFLTLTFALVSLLAGIFQPSQWAWVFGAAIVTAAYFIGAVGLFVLGRRELTQAGLVPTRTLRVLKEDQIWIQNEARSQV